MNVSRIFSIGLLAVSVAALYLFVSFMISLLLSVSFKRQYAKLFGRRHYVMVTMDMNPYAPGYPYHWYEATMWPVLLPVLIVMKISGVGADPPPPPDPHDHAHT